MKKRLIPIYSVLVVAIVLLVAFIPSCGGGGGGEKGTIEVKATLDGSPWPGAVNYTLTPGSGSPISGTEVPKTFSADVGSWTCAYISGGPGNFTNITPLPTQSVPSGGAITFTINFTTTPIIRASKDAEVRENTPTINYGGEPEMMVAPSDCAMKHRSFVWFSLASLPAGAQVQSATLYLYHSGCYGSGIDPYGAYRVTDVWEELIITWTNQPPSAPNQTDDITFDVCDTGKWRSWNVTPDIDAIAIETGWVSWVIKHIYEDEHEHACTVFSTKEDGVAPYLEITYIP